MSRHTFPSQHYVESYLSFLLFLIKLNCLFLIRLLSKVARKGNTAEISVFYSGRHDTVILTPLPRTGMFSKIWRAILVEVVGPKAPHWMILQTSHLSRNNPIFLQNSTLKRACPIFDRTIIYFFTKLHPQEGMSYIWLVKGNLQAPPLTIPLPI